LKAKTLLCPHILAGFLATAQPAAKCRKENGDNSSYEKTIECLVAKGFLFGSWQN
jgi:hypothetical protein